MNKGSYNNLYILLVEDNPDDVLLTKIAFEESTVINHLHAVEDGEEAIKFLQKETPYIDVPRPQLILLDLNLPRMSGHEVLEKIKQDNRLKDIPVVILTTSNYEEDIIKSYRLHANCYIKKPVDLDDFHKVVKVIEHYWFDVVTLPPREC
jgi:two-component system, chemotaxis family, response regulator Rcp1